MFLGNMAFADDLSKTAVAARQYIASLSEDGAPGCALGVYDMRANRWLHRDAFGLADLEHDRKITAEDVFGVASVTKQFTAAAVAIAAIEGRLNLDDDVRQHIPELPDYADALTIRDLIQHTNGLRDIGRLTMLTGRQTSYLSQQSRIALLTRQAALNFEPGEEFRYGNSGYLLLAEIIQRVTGERFADYADRVIFDPLHMSDTYFGAQSRTDTVRAHPYSLAGDHWRNDDPYLIGDGDWGHQGLMTTLGDYAKWISNLYADESKLAGGAGLTAALRTQGKKRDGALIPYGFGLRFETYKGLPTVGHGGSNLGYKAHAMIFPDRSVAVIGFCNNGRYAQPIVMKLADIVLGLEDVPDQDESENTITAAVNSGPAPETWLSFAGAYREQTLRLPMFVEPRADGLHITGDAAPGVYRPIGANRFRSDDNLEITFERDAAGDVAALVQTGRRKYGGGRFVRIERALPSPDQLRQYEGDYFSAELGATYRFSVENGTLAARILDGDAYSMSPFSLQPMLAREFVSPEDRIAIRFEPDRKGRPAGFKLTYQFGWITDVRFQRIAD